MDRKKRIDFLSVVLFVGILLSFLLYIGLGAWIGEREGDAKNGQFSREFYSDPWMISVARYGDYRIFHHTDAENILLGRQDWVFCTVDENNGYDYLLDYVGGCAFSEEETAQIAENIAADRARYAQQGIEYAVIVVPSSMTVCEAYLPEYLGRQSEYTRLSALSDALDAETAFVDLTDVMREASQEEIPYNNTEDSLNSYGAFQLYNAVMSHLNDRPGEPYARIRKEELSFSVRMTEGRSAAQKAGLASIAQNRTVSLTDNAIEEHYVATEQRDHCMVTELASTSEWAGNGVSLLLEVSSEWDRTLFMPFFSNTFDTVAYEQRTGELETAIEVHQPTVIVRVIHENELSVLLGE